MKKILVHVHIFYTEKWYELKKCLKNIEYPYDLHVSMIEKYSSIIEDILSFNKNANIQIVSNVGYDVWPFIKVLNEVDLDEYEYVVKLHTKRYVEQNSYINNFSTKYDKWKNYLLSFIKTKKNFQKCIQAFENDEKLGMAANFKIILRNYVKDQTTTPNTKIILREMGFNDTVEYVAGTMFICRAKLLKKIQEVNLQEKLFPNNPCSANSGTFAHTVEQLLGSIIVAQGYKIEDPFSFKNKKNIAILHYLREKKRYKAAVAKSSSQTKQESKNNPVKTIRYETIKFTMLGIPILKIKIKPITKKFYLFNVQFFVIKKQVIRKF